ncbi:MAG: ketopantoate reductase family protein, partial [Spirochaetota bacterium]
ISDMIRATRECFLVLKALHVKVTPAKLNFYYLPLCILVPVYMAVMNSRIAEYAMAKHTIAAKGEMAALQAEFEKLIKRSGVDTPAFARLAKK